MTEYPTAKKFEYVFIPADATKEIETHRFDGNDDAAFRESITAYFRTVPLSDGQKIELAKHLIMSADEQRKKSAMGKDDVRRSDRVEEIEESGGKVMPVLSENEKRAITEYVSNTSYEIIPIEMPTRATNFIGTSLYIDGSGRFKELRSNARASHIAQQDIRGDAFLLSNHDDPALDEWGRVDCTVARYHDLVENPRASPAYNKTGPSASDPTAQLREKDSKRIEPEEVVKAQSAKEEGNKLFQKGDLPSAIASYTEVVNLTEGRRDLLPNEAEVTALRVSSLLNRSLCYLKLNKAHEAEVDARTATVLDGSNVKAHFRLASALLQRKEFDAALASVLECEKYGGVTADSEKLKNDIAETKKRTTQEEKKMFAKMFAA